MKEMLECVWSSEVQERGKQRDQIWRNFELCQKFKRLWQSFKRQFSICQLFFHTLAEFLIGIRQIFSAQTGKILKK